MSIGLNDHLKPKSQLLDELADARRQVERLRAHENELEEIKRNLQETLHDLSVHQEQLRVQNEELRNIRQELGASERKYQRLFNWAPVGYFALDHNTVMQEVNLTGAEMLGVGRNHLIGKPLFLYVAQASRNALQVYLRSTLENAGAPPVEVTFRAGNAGTFVGAVQAILLHDGPQSGPLYLMAAMDISDRKQTEEALRRREAELGAIFDGAPIVMLLVDKERRLRKANRATAEFVGQPNSELVGHRGGDALRCLHATDDPQGCGCGPDCQTCPVRGAVQDTFETGKNHHAVEAVLQFQRGDETVQRSVQVSTSVVDSSDERLVLLCLTDVTEHKQAEAEVRSTQEKLLQQQRREQHRIELANRELARRNRELQDFAHVVSHDLRSPLVNIQGFSGILTECCDRARATLARTADRESLSEELSSLLEEEIPDALGYIQTSSSKMDLLLAGLLKISRIGSAALSIEELDMNRIVAEIVRSMEFSIEATGATVHVDDLPPCRGDRTQIVQVISNLLDNAVKYLEPKRRGAIRVSACREPGRVVYCVEDNGIGIDPDHQEAVFRPFHRLDSHQGNGLGLGLTIVRRIVDRQGGKLWLESTPNQGSKFYVAFPG